MKNLPLPDVDDIQKITDNANNSALHRTSYPYLRDELETVLLGYQNYHLNNGNALTVSHIEISDELAEGLRKNYKPAPKDLRFINHIRNSSPNVCPMCGSLKASTVDHLFPKEDYPWFAVYSKNLIPACDCNSKRGQNLYEGNQRVLHPYYDEILGERHLSCLICADPEFPIAKIELAFVQERHEYIESIRYHAEKVVLPSGIINWLEGEWETTTLNPSSKIQTLPLANIPTIEDFSRYLNDALNRYDQSYSTPNNWFSIFIHGVLNSEGVLEFLFEKHNSFYPIV